MRVLIALDQHPDTLGGAQQSALLQRDALERAGHRVLFLAPGPHTGVSSPVTVEFPARAIPGQEYRACLPTRSGVRAAGRRLDALGGADVVHVQGDYWGAVHGLAYAHSRRLPVVATFHNNMEAGMRAVLGPLAVPALPLLTSACSALLRHVLGHGSARPPADPWHYLGRIADHAAVCTTGTRHFAHALRAHGTTSQVEAVSNGISDAVLAALPVRDAPERVTFVWSGRFSAEKRPLEFLTAVSRTRDRFAVRMYGDGPLRAPVEAAVRRLELEDRVTLVGRVPYPEMLTGMAAAHALVQTSVGFETQGMTVFESLTVGTPVVVCDPDIAAEFSGQGIWQVGEGGDVESLAAALERAVEDLLAGPVPVRLDHDFRQSAQTATMIRLYEQALAVPAVRLAHPAVGARR